MVESLGLTQETFTPDRLIASGPIYTGAITLISGQNLTRGALLGKITKALGTVSAVTGTGDGAVTGAALKAKAQLGAYTLKCVEAAVNGGRFEVIAPNGESLGDAVVGAAYTSPHLDFTINDGATDFVVGDYFTIAVDAGSGKHTLSLAASVDGSQEPHSILAKDTDASAGDIDTVNYEKGQFNDNAVTYGTGHTAASVKDALQARDIYLKSPVKA